MYQAVATNLKMARKKRGNKVPIPDKKLKEVDSV